MGGRARAYLYIGGVLKLHKSHRRHRNRNSGNHRCVDYVRPSLWLFRHRRHTRRVFRIRVLTLFTSTIPVARKHIKVWVGRVYIPRLPLYTPIQGPLHFVDDSGHTELIHTVRPTKRGAYGEAYLYIPPLPV